MSSCLMLTDRGHVGQEDNEKILPLRFGSVNHKFPQFRRYPPASADHPSSRLLIVRCCWYRSEDLLQEARLGHGAEELDLVVHHGLWDRLHRVPCTVAGEFVCLHDIGGDERAFHRHLVGQPGHRGAMWSGWCDKHLEVEWRRHGSKCLACGF